MKTPAAPTVGAQSGILTREKLQALLRLDARQHGHSSRHWSEAAIAQYLRKHEHHRVPVSTVRQQLLEHGFQCRAGVWSLPPSVPKTASVLLEPQTDARILAQPVKFPPGLNRNPLFPTHTEFAVLQALFVAGGELTRAALKVELAAGERTLPALAAAGYIDAPLPRGRGRSEEMPVQIMVAGARLLKHLTPHLAALYPEKNTPAALDALSLRALYALQAHPAGLYPDDLARIAKLPSAASARTHCQRLSEAKLCMRRSYLKAPFYKITRAGVRLLRTMSALYGEH